MPKELNETSFLRSPSIQMAVKLSGDIFNDDMILMLYRLPLSVLIIYTDMVWQNYAKVFGIHLMKYCTRDCKMNEKDHILI